MEGERAIIGGKLNGKIVLHSGEQSSSGDLTDRVHLLPCVVKLDGPCPVSHYFKPRQSNMDADDGLAVEEAYFRGRKLQGVNVPIPGGYRGYILEKKKIKEGCSEVVEEEANSWASRAEFQNITYWNHDSFPSKHDPVVRSFHWFSIADALHKPITEEELASVSTIPDC